MTPASADHVRENLGLLARLEKRTLLAIAHRLPDGINSDHLSALGLGAMAAAGLSFAAFPASRWAAAGVIVSLAVNWFGDSLDGTVARVRNQTRPRYGFYVDHVIDLAGTAMLLGGMAVSGLLSPLLAGVLLSAYLLVTAESFLATHAVGRFRMSFMGFGPTELRILIAAGALKAALTPWVTVAGYTVRLFDIGAAVAIPGLLIAFTVACVRNGLALYRLEPMPARSEATRAA